MRKTTDDATSSHCVLCVGDLTPEPVTWHLRAAQERHPEEPKATWHSEWATWHNEWATT